MKRTHRSFADGKGRGSTFPKTLATLALALLGFTTEAASYATDGARQWDLAEPARGIDVEVIPSGPLSGTYWSAQLTNWPPWPYLPFPELPVYVVGDGSFVFDDREVDYVALEQEAIAWRLLTEAQNS